MCTIQEFRKSIWPQKTQKSTKGKALQINSDWQSNPLVDFCVFLCFLWQNASVFSLG